MLWFSYLSFQSFILQHFKTFYGWFMIMVLPQKASVFIFKKYVYGYAIPFYFIHLFFYFCVHCTWMLFHVPAVLKPCQHRGHQQIAFSQVKNFSLLCGVCIISSCMCEFPPQKKTCTHVGFLEYSYTGLEQLSLAASLRLPTSLKRLGPVSSLPLFLF